ncbi:MAG: cytochrome b/b6 domain-containing protein [Pseudomonadales bacterium]
MEKSTVKPWPLWDLPTRLGHGLFIAALLLAWWSAETQRTDLHEWTGYVILVLVVSRLVWGIVGSKHSRFATFLKSPPAAFNYLLSSAKERSESAIDNKVVGHNPAGGWSVVLMLSLLLLQAVSGLFNSDDILFSGPFYHLVESDWQDRFGVVHDYAFNALIICISLHVMAVLFYTYRGKKLIVPMIRGGAADRYSDEAPKPSWRWLAILLIVALALWAAVQSAPQPSNQWF